MQLIRLHRTYLPFDANTEQWEACNKITSSSSIETKGKGEKVNLPHWTKPVVPELQMGVKAWVAAP